MLDKNNFGKFLNGMGFKLVNEYFIVYLWLNLYEISL